MHIGLALPGVCDHREGFGANAAELLIVRLPIGHPFFGTGEGRPREVAITESPVGHRQEKPVERRTARLQAHRLFQLGDGRPDVAAAVVRHSQGIPVIRDLGSCDGSLLRQAQGQRSVAEARRRARRKEPGQIIVNGRVVVFQLSALRKDAAASVIWPSF